MLSAAGKWFFHAMQAGRRISQYEDGATMIEFAIMFPIVLLVSGFIIAASHLYSAETSLRTAVSTARLAHTRAKFKLIDDIEDWINGGPVPPGWPQPYLATPNQSAGAMAYYQSKFNWIYNQSSPAVDLTKVPKSVYYAMAYAYGQLRESLSSNLEFPCEHPGCVTCYPRYPILDYSLLLNPNPIIPPINSMGANPVPGDVDFEADFTGIVCDYYVSNIFLDIFVVGVNAIPGLHYNYPNIMIRKQSWYWTQN